MKKIFSLLLLFSLSIHFVQAQKAVNSLSIFQDSVISNFQGEFLGKHAGIDKSLAHHTIWQAIAEGKIRLHNFVSSYLPSLPSTFDSVRLSHLLYETSGLGANDNPQVLLEGQLSRKLNVDQAFERSAANTELILTVLAKLQLDSNLRMYREAHYKPEQLLRLQVRFLNGEGLLPVFNQKLKTPMIRTGEKGLRALYTGSWFMSHQNGKDSLALYFYPAESGEKNFYYFSIPSLSYHLLLQSDKTISDQELLRLLSNKLESVSGHKLNFPMKGDPDFLMLSLTLLALSLALLWLNRKKGKRRKSFRSSNNSIAILILILSLGLLAIYLIFLK